MSPRDRKRELVVNRIDTRSFSYSIIRETWGSRIFTAMWTAWVLAIPTTLSARTPTEDEILHRKFGDEWEAYAKRTPYRLIPFVY